MTFDLWPLVTLTFAFQVTLKLTLSLTLTLVNTVSVTEIYTHVDIAMVIWKHFYRAGLSSDLDLERMVQLWALFATFYNTPRYCLASYTQECNYGVKVIQLSFNEL